MITEKQGVLFKRKAAKVIKCFCGFPIFVMTLLTLLVP